MRHYIDTDALAELLSRAPDQGVGAAARDGAGAGDRSILLDAWYTLLVGQTVDWAARTVPFYAERWASDGPGSRPAFDVLGDLLGLPVISRADLAHAPAFLSTEVKASGAASTSGTTGRRVTVYTSDSENRANAVFRELRRGRSSVPADPVVLRVIPGNRRTHIAQATSESSGVAVIAVGYNASQPTMWFDYTDHLIEVLSEPYRLDGRERHVSMMHITPPSILDVITQHLVQKHIEPSFFGLTDIALSGAFLGEHTRKLVETAWGARWHHSYSCAEVRAEMMCDRDDRTVFHVPANVLCEILDVRTGEPVGGGEAGRVVLSSLFPFQQAMPFIRYANGDIAQRVDDGQTLYARAVRPIGREGDVIALGPRAFLGPRDAVIALTSFEEIPQILYPHFHLALSNTGVLELDVEVTLPGYSSTGMTPDAIEIRLRQEIGRYGYPRELLPAAIRCRLLPKNSLREFPRIIPDR